MLIKLSPLILATFYTAVFFSFAIVGIDLIAITFPGILVFMMAENHFYYLHSIILLPLQIYFPIKALPQQCSKLVDAHASLRISHISIQLFAIHIFNLIEQCFTLKWRQFSFCVRLIEKRKKPFLAMEFFNQVFRPSIICFYVNDFCTRFWHFVIMRPILF